MDGDRSVKSIQLRECPEGGTRFCELTVSFGFVSECAFGDQLNFLQ